MKFLFLLLMAFMPIFVYGQKVHTTECRYYDLTKTPKPGAELCKLCHKASANDSNNPTFTCGTLTKKGTPCKRRVKAQGDKCPQHR